MADPSHDDAPTPHRSSKPTRRWCRGRPGVEHRPVCMPHAPHSRWIPATWRELVCTVCGRKLDAYRPLQLPGCVPGPAPGWVDR